MGLQLDTMYVLKCTSIKIAKIYIVLFKGIGSIFAINSNFLIAISLQPYGA